MPSLRTIPRRHWRNLNHASGQRSPRVRLPIDRHTRRVRQWLAPRRQTRKFRQATTTGACRLKRRRPEANLSVRLRSASGRTDCPRSRSAPGPRTRRSHRTTPTGLLGTGFVHGRGSRAVRWRPRYSRPLLSPEPTARVLATQPRVTPSFNLNPTGSTSYQLYPEATTGPRTTFSWAPSGSTGSYVMESSLTRGSERTRSRSETVTTTVFRSGSP